MSLLDLFDSRDKKARMSHVRNVIAVAFADTVLTKDEEELIFRIGNRVGLTNEELKRILIRPNSISFTPPRTNPERVIQLLDMVLVMMVDGEINEREYAICKLTAIKLGFRHEIIDKMIDDIIDYLAKGMAVDIILNEILKRT